jgi:Flp pilus assembly protein TadG
MIAVLRRRRDGRPRRSERGAVLVLTSLLMVTVLGMTALVVDLGALRGNVRVDQSIADFAALAAGKSLGVSNPTAACQSAINYINTNANLSSSIDATTFCSGMATTSCSGGSGQAAPQQTVGSYTVSIHYPVPDSEISDSHVVGGTHPNDGAACQRMRVLVSSAQNSMFSKVLGYDALSGTRSATVRPWTVGPTKTPALWLLDPTGCVALSVGGGSKVTVGTSSVPGVVSIDSDGSTCQSNQNTVSSSGAGTLLTAVPTTGSDPGSVQLFAMPSGATTCSAPACAAADVTAGRISPQPISVSARATRSRVDDKYNCKGSYPNYHGITLTPNCNTTTTPPYIDNLQTSIGTSGTPTGYTAWSPTHSCNPSGTVPPVNGNIFVNCPGNGLSMGNGTTVTINGNIVFQSGIKMTGGVLNINTNNPNAAGLPASCKPPTTVGIPCIGSSSSNAAFVYVRAGNIDITGGTLQINHAMVYLASGYLSVNSSPPTWRAPTEGPFNYLALWSDMPSTSNNTGKFAMAGGAGVTLAGIFFIPEANPFSLTGGGTWGQQNAQFIAFQLAVSGGGVLTMAPDPTQSVTILSFAGTLIR